MFQSDLDVDFSEAVVQGGGVTQQQHSSVFPRLVDEGVKEASNADKAQSLPAARRQGEIALSDPAEDNARAVRGDAWQRIRPQPKDEVRGRLGGRWEVFRCAGVGFRGGGKVRLFALRRHRGRGSFFGGLLPAFNPAFKVVSMRGLLRATADRPFTQ